MDRLGFCSPVPPLSSLRLRGRWIKSYWKLSDASLCLTNCCVGKTVTRSVYHCIIILRIFWLGHGNIHDSSEFWLLFCILSHEFVRYLTKINLYNLMWKVFRWSQKDKSNTMRQKVPDFLIVFCPHMKLSELGSDPGYLIELNIRHLGHPLEIKNKRRVWNILLKKIIWAWFIIIASLTMSKIW